MGKCICLSMHTAHIGCKKKDIHQRMMCVCFHMLMYIYITFNSLTWKFECIHVLV